MNGWNKTILTTILAILSITGTAVASPLTTFADEPAAKQHCPRDTVLWVDLSTHTYYTKSEFCYGRTKNGAYVCEHEAQKTGAIANRWSRSTVLGENDSLFFNSDKHYTQGLRLSFLRPEPARDGWWETAFDLLGHIPSFFAPLSQEAGANKRQVSLFVGQSIFTPENKAIVPPDPHDRPYAGWAYSGASLLQETALRTEAGGETLGMLENAELDIGLVGPGALGKKVQNDFHQFIGDPQAQGWSSQLQNEPGIVLRWLIPLSQVGQYVGLADRIRNGAGFDSFGRS